MDGEGHKESDFHAGLNEPQWLELAADQDGVPGVLLSFQALDFACDEAVGDGKVSMKETVEYIEVVTDD